MNLPIYNIVCSYLLFSILIYVVYCESTKRACSVTETTAKIEVSLNNQETYQPLSQKRIVNYTPGQTLYFKCKPDCINGNNADLAWIYSKDKENSTEIVMQTGKNTNSLVLNMTAYDFDNNSKLTCKVNERDFVNKPELTLIQKEVAGQHFYNEITKKINDTFVEQCSDKSAYVYEIGDRITRTQSDIIKITNEHSKAYILCHSTTDVNDYTLKRVITNITLIKIMNNQSMGIDSRNGLPVPNENVDKDSLIIIGNNDNLFIIIGSTVAVLIIALLLSCLIYWRVRKNQGKSEPEYADPSLLYADLQLPRASPNTPPKQDQPYAQIIGVMQPKNKN